MDHKRKKPGPFVTRRPAWSLAAFFPVVDVTKGQACYVNPASPCSCYPVHGPCDPGNPSVRRARAGRGSDSQDRMDQIIVMAQLGQDIAKPATKGSSAEDEQAEPDWVLALEGPMPCAESRWPKSRWARRSQFSGSSASRPGSVGPSVRRSGLPCATCAEDRPSPDIPIGTNRSGTGTCHRQRPSPPDSSALRQVDAPARRGRVGCGLMAQCLAYGKSVTRRSLFDEIRRR